MSKVTGDRCQRRSEPPRIRTEEELAAQHAGEWQEWQEKLTPDERAQLDRVGLTAPTPPRRRRKPRHVEADEDFPGLGTCDHVASDGLDPYAALVAKERAQGLRDPDDEESVHPVVAEYATENRRELVLLRYALPAIADAEDPRLEVSIIALALGMGAIHGITIIGLCKRHRLNEDEVRRRVRRWVVATDVCRADLALLKFFLSPILASRTPALEAEVIAKAARIGSNAPTMETLGQKHGVCRQAISRRVRSWCDRLGLPLPRECKRNTDAYRLSNVRKQAIDPFQP